MARRIRSTPAPRVPQSNVIYLHRLYPGRFQGPPEHAARRARIAALLADAVLRRA